GDFFLCFSRRDSTVLALQPKHQFTNKIHVACHHATTDTDPRSGASILSEASVVTNAVSAPFHAPSVCPVSLSTTRVSIRSARARHTDKGAFARRFRWAAWLLRSATSALHNSFRCGTASSRRQHPNRSDTDLPALTVTAKRQTSVRFDNQSA